MEGVLSYRYVEIRERVRPWLPSDQFHPSEFSATIGAEMPCARALAPRLPRLPGLMAAPCMTAPYPMPPAASEMLLVTELDRLCRLRLFLYRRATKNIAAPYKAAPPATPQAIPTPLEVTVPLELPTGDASLELPPLPSEPLSPEPLP